MTATAKNVTSAGNFTTQTGTLSYPSLLAPKQNRLSKDPKMEFEATIIWGPDVDIKPIKAWALETWTKKWGTDKSKWPQRRNESGQMVSALQTPFRLCEEKRNADGTQPLGYPAGGTWVRCASKFQPGLINKYGQKIIHENEIYAGCQVILEVNCFVWEYAGKHGISLGLLNVMKMGDGPSLGGRAPAEKVFKAFISPLPPGGVPPRESESLDAADDAMSGASAEDLL